MAVWSTSVTIFRFLILFWNFQRWLWAQCLQKVSGVIEMGLSEGGMVITPFPCGSTLCQAQCWISFMDSFVQDSKQVRNNVVLQMRQQSHRSLFMGLQLANLSPVCVSPQNTSVNFIICFSSINSSKTPNQNTLFWVSFQYSGKLHSKMSWLVED